MNTLPEFNPKTHVVTVKRLPDWASSTDVIMRRGHRYWLVSQQRERRWRKPWRWFLTGAGNAASRFGNKP
jgi:hypothetical protein